MEIKQEFERTSSVDYLLFSVHIILLLVNNIPLYSWAKQLLQNNVTTNHRSIWSLVGNS
jgi:hypothetical protein